MAHKNDIARACDAWLKARFPDRPTGFQMWKWVSAPKKQERSEPKPKKKPVDPKPKLTKDQYRERCKQTWANMSEEAKAARMAKINATRIAKAKARPDNHLPRWKQQHNLDYRREWNRKFRKSLTPEQKERYNARKRELYAVRMANKLKG